MVTTGRDILNLEIGVIQSISDDRKRGTIKVDRTREMEFSFDSRRHICQLGSGSTERNGPLMWAPFTSILRSEGIVDGHKKIFFERRFHSRGESILHWAGWEDSLFVVTAGTGTLYVIKDHTNRKVWMGWYSEATKCRIDVAGTLPQCVFGLEIGFVTSGMSLPVKGKASCYRTLRNAQVLEEGTEEIPQQRVTSGRRAM